MSQNKKTEWLSIRIPPGVRERLKASAEANHRSMASQILAIVEEHLKKTNV